MQETPGPGGEAGRENRGTHWDFGVHKSTMTHHFRALREAGLTRTVVSGRTHTIELRRDELDARFPGLIDALTATDVPSPGTARR